MGTETEAPAIATPRSERRERTHGEARGDTAGSLDAGLGVLDGPLSVEGIEKVQRSAGNKAATELVERDRRRPAQLAPHFASNLRSIQRDEIDDPDEAGPQDDPGLLQLATAEQLIELYLTEQPTSAVPGTDATYTLDWLQSGRGSARIREALINQLVMAEPSPEVHQSYHRLVEQSGGPEERTRDLKALIDATFVPREPIAEETLVDGTLHLAEQGYFLELPIPPKKENQKGRPKLRYEAADMVPFEGALVHPAVVAALTSLLAGLRNEGARLNDESARQAVINNGFRPPTQREGNKYLSSIRATIRKAVDVWGNPFHYPAFPTALEGQATSELGWSGSTAHQAFERALAASPGWTAPQADMLLRTTGTVKAPRGGSTHHSGLTVDIDWPAWKGRRASRHGMDRDNNGAALASVAGRWLYEQADSFGFASYDTGKEIWHMEWLDWKGTAADPDA
jgi:hypothetical protein